MFVARCDELLAEPAARNGFRVGFTIEAELNGEVRAEFRESLDEEARTSARRGLNELPDQIGLVSLRKLVPIMCLLDVGQPSNQLSAEALAAAVLLGAGLRVTTDSPMLRAGAERLHLSYNVVSV